MKKLVKKIFDSQYFKRAMINMLYSNPNLTAAEYLRLSNILREMDNNANQEIKLEMKKAS